MLYQLLFLSTLAFASFFFARVRLVLMRYIICCGCGLGVKFTNFIHLIVVAMINTFG